MPTYVFTPKVSGAVIVAADVNELHAPIVELGGIVNGIYKAGGTDVAVADGGTGASTAAGARTNLELSAGTTKLGGDFDPRDRGAVWDGVTNDQTALTNTQTEIITAGRGALILPPGRGSFGGSGLLIKAGKLHLKGRGEHASEIMAASTIATLLQSPSNIRHDEVILENFTLDGTGITAAMAAFYGSYIDRLKIRNVIFKNIASVGLSLNGIQDVDVEHVEFWNGGTGDGIGISMAGGGARSVRLADIKMRWLATGISIDTGAGLSEFENLADYVRMENIDYDGYWYLLPVLSGFTNSGGTVSYTSTVLTDSAASFSGVTNTIVRAMAQTDTGSITSTTNVSMTVTGENFLSSGLTRGDIIRVGGTSPGGKWTIVSGIQSNTVVMIEGWMDHATGLPVAPPAAASTFFAYHVTIGQTVSSTATTITVDRWVSVDGVLATPSAGTRYEVSRDRTSYPILVESSAKHVIVDGCVIRRPWADGISIYSPQATITRNIVEFGMDTGITLNGGYNYGNTQGNSIIANNQVDHMGAQGIACSANATVIHDNQVSESRWLNQSNIVSGADIVVYNKGLVDGDGGSRCNVHHNTCDGKGKAYATYGIALVCFGSTNPLADTILDTNKVRGHSLSEYRIRSDGGVLTPTGIKITGVDIEETGGTFLTGTNDAVLAGVVVDVWGNGTPEGVIYGDSGSLFRRKDGAATTSLYVKGSAGNLKTGWVALGASGGGGPAAIPGIVIAASDSHQSDKDSADYLCDGTADNVELQTAIDSAVAVGGTFRIRALPGTYNLADTVTMKSNITFEGSGWKTIFKAINALNKNCFKSAATDEASKIDNVRMAHFQVDGNKANQTDSEAPPNGATEKYGITLNGAMNCIIEDVWVKDTIHTGIYMGGPSNTVIRCKVTGVGKSPETNHWARSGIVFNKMVTVQCDYIRCLNNIVEDVREHGIKVYEGCVGVEVSGNQVGVSLDFGIWMHGVSHSKVHNNRVTGANEIGIYVGVTACNDVDITDNKVRNTTVDATDGGGHGIQINALTGGVVSGNSCTGNGSVGIRIVNSFDLAVGINSCRSNVGFGIYEAGTSNRNSYTGNVSRLNGANSPAENLTIIGAASVNGGGNITA